MKMRKLLLLGLLLLLATSVSAQDVAQFQVAYDVDSGTFTYCRTTGANASPFGSQLAGPGTVATSGSATAVTSSGNFGAIAVGDVIMVRRSSGAVDIRIVDVKTDTSNITVDTAVDWSGGFAWTYYKTTCGTTDADGWIDVSSFKEFTITVSYDQGNLGAGLEARWECKSSALETLPVIVYPGESDGCGGGTLSSGVCLYATAGIATRTTVAFFEPQTSCRVGTRASGGTDASDATTNRERVSVSLRGRK